MNQFKIYTKKTIAVLMTVHNRKEKTLACLKSLYGCILPEEYKFNVFLVNDGSTDGTREAILRYFPQVKVIQGDGNLYWNRGMYLAWQTAIIDNDFDYYLWLNDDTYLFYEALAEVLSCSNLVNEESIICGITCSNIENNIPTYGGQKLRVGILPPNGNMQSCDFFNGNFVLVPQYVFKQIGNLDRTFHHIFGDFDYGNRAKKGGINLYTTRIFIGICEKHDSLPRWCTPKEKLISRIKDLYSPLGCNPFELYHFDKRHANLTTAFFHFVTVHIRVFLPKLWNKKPQLIRIFRH